MSRLSFEQGGTRRARSRVGRFWWVGVLRGTIALVLGFSVLLASGAPERLATYLAIYWLAGGLLTIRAAMALWPSRGARLSAVAGAVAITAALLVAARGSLSAAVSPATAVNALGFAAAGMGTLRLVGAFEIERRTGRRWTIGGLILGGLELGTGILLIVTDTQTGSVMVTVGAWGLVSGTLLIIQAIRVRKLARTIPAVLGS